MSNNEILFSIICPFYNSSSFLNEAIESVYSQTFHNWELILINDGSKDNSPSIASEWAKKDLRIKVYSIQNSGTFAARNYGVGLAKGRFIVFLDSDDYLERDTLTVLKNEIGKEFVDIILFNLSTFGPDDIQKKDIIQITKKLIVKGKNSIIEKTFIEHEFGYGVCGCCFSKELFLKPLLFHVPNIKSAEDILLAYSLFSSSSCILFLPNTLYHYRMNPKSTTHSMTAKDYSDCLKVFVLIYGDIYMKYNGSINLRTNNKIFWGCFSYIIHAPKLISFRDYLSDCKLLRNSVYFKRFIKRYKYPSKRIVILRNLLNLRFYYLLYFLVKKGFAAK